MVLNGGSIISIKSRGFGVMPKVSVIIVTFSGRKYVADCLAAVFASLYEDIEVIIVDNGSEDDTVSFLKKKYGERDNFKLISLDKNYGPAYARNRGVEEASGKYLAFLDNDTRPNPNWLLEPVQLMEADPAIGVCQCKLLMMDAPDRIDYVGDYLSQFGFLIQRAEHGVVDRGQFDEPVEIFSAKSAGMLVRKEAFEKAGGFDEDYFIYVEETDLAWRVWLGGYRSVFSPRSVVYHKFGTSAVILGGKQIFMVRAYGCRNYLATLFKNLGVRALFKIFPVHFLLWLGIVVFLVLKGKIKDGFFVLWGMGDFVFRLGGLSRKRRTIQKGRLVSDEELLPRIMKRQPLGYFVAKFTQARREVKTPEKLC